MGARKEFICGIEPACRSAHLACCGHCAPVDDGVVRVGSPVEVWNTDSLYWVECRVLGFRTGVGSLDGVIVGAGLAGAAFTFVPWTLIR